MAAPFGSRPTVASPTIRVGVERVCVGKSAEGVHRFPRHKRGFARVVIGEAGIDRSPCVPRQLAVRPLAPRAIVSAIAIATLLSACGSDSDSTADSTADSTPGSTDVATSDATDDTTDAEHRRQWHGRRRPNGGDGDA